MFQSEDYDLYQDIQTRTNGELFLGVVCACTYRKIDIYPQVYESGNDSRNGS